MNIDGRAWRTIFPSADGFAVEIIDQNSLPHAFHVRRLETLEDAAHAIRTMQVRGAPLIGAAAAYGMGLATKVRTDDAWLEHAASVLVATRPTAVNLRWAVERMLQVLKPLSPGQRCEEAWLECARICEQDVAINQAIGHHGARLLQQLHQEKGAPLNILTHCNAGWLATVDWGTALSPVYMAHDAGVPLHVWADETRPRNQGASLTAWELGRHGVRHTVITDNAGGHLMQDGQVDVVIVGADRVTATGDVCNKIGTYLKALAAFDTGVPFYAAVPSPTIDWNMHDGLREIPIEQRGEDEVAWIQGRTMQGEIVKISLLPEHCLVANPAFDVTPARLVTGIITERGICPPDQIRNLFT